MRMVYNQILNVLTNPSEKKNSHGNGTTTCSKIVVEMYKRSPGIKTIVEENPINNSAVDTTEKTTTLLLRDNDDSPIGENRRR